MNSLLFDVLAIFPEKYFSDICVISENTQLVMEYFCNIKRFKNQYHFPDILCHLLFYKYFKL